MIDFHAHLGNCFRENYQFMKSISTEQLIDRMDRDGIEIAVLLPLESPEVCPGYFLTEDAVAARDLYPERLIAFVGLDPRQPSLEKQFDVFVERYGCRGFGELLNGLPFADPRNKVIYAKCNEHRLPLVFDMSGRDLWDEVGLPGLEECLREFPEMTFCGHGPTFWSAISADDPRAGYPSGRIKPGGAIDRLMDSYENLWLDLSAGSGFNALTRDPAFTAGFIERHWRRMLWATDYFIVNQPIPQVNWIKTIDVTPEVRDAIAFGNARRLLGITPG